MSVPVVIEPRATRAPANLFIIETCLARHVCKRAITIVAEQDVVSPKAAEQIVPAIVVVIAYAYTGLPTRPSDSGFLRNVSKRSVPIVLIQVRSGRGAGGPLGVQSRSVGQIDIEPAVAVVIKEGQPAALR